MWMDISLMIVAAILIGYAGPKLSRYADKLGEVTGLGQTAAGIIFLGASTSIPGIFVTFKAALQGQANLAVSNSIGGIAAQTMFLACADLALRKSKITKSTKKDVGLLQASMLIVLLSLISLALIAPKIEVFNFHPITPLLLIFVWVAFRFVQNLKRNPRWRPVDETEGEESSQKDSEQQPSKKEIYKKYFIYLLLVIIGGWLISYSGGKVLEQTSFSQVIMGATILAVITSLPELVTAVSAVRQGRISMAIGDILGGNIFDTTMIVIADLAYFKGSIYPQVSTKVLFLLGLSILMMALMLAGFLRREDKGVGHVALESLLIIVFYFAGISLIIFSPGNFLS